MNEAIHHLDVWTQQLLQRVSTYFVERQCRAYLVGGSVRNLLLNEICIDWDIVTDGNAHKLARQLANEIGGYYAHLNTKASRIVVKRDGQEIIIDIAPLHGETIEEDLLQRDFTINAIAIPLSNLADSLSTDASLAPVDPLHGANDIESRCLRTVSDSVFKQDPLRMLRAVRFRMSYSLTVDRQTEAMLTRDAPLLLKAAAERIHDELYAILKPANATERLRYLDRHDLFMVLFPEFIAARGMPQPDLHNWDVLDHSIETVSALEHLAAVLQQSPEEVRLSPLNTGQDDLLAVQALLEEAEQQHIFSFAQLISPQMKLAALLHDVGKPSTYTVDVHGNIHFYHHPQAGVPFAQQISRRLSTSTQDRRLIQQIVAHHMRPGQLSQDMVTERAIRRYFVDLGPMGIMVALVALADHLAMRGPRPLTEAWERQLATVRLLFTRYVRERERILPPRLLQPDELMRRFHLKSGPLLGQLLEAIAEAQAEGKVR